jgi:hypothetical protein
MFSARFLAPLLDRVKAIVRRVARPVAKRARPVPAIMSPDAPISPATRGRAQEWMSAKLRALSALMRRIEAGETFDPPNLQSRQAAPTPAPCAAAFDADQPAQRLPRGFGWMCAFVPNLSQDGAAFADWLNEPWMRERVLAAPERMAVLVGPILTATGQCRPDWFPARRARTRKTQGPSTSSPGEDQPGRSAATSGSEESFDAESQRRGTSSPDASPGWVSMPKEDRRFITNSIRPRAPRFGMRLTHESDFATSARSWPIAERHCASPPLPDPWRRQRREFSKIETFRGRETRAHFVTIC